jgi:hypothetical protein
LGESTDITVDCQLIFVRIIDRNFKIKEEFLKLQPLTTVSKGSDVVEEINKVVSEFTSLEKCAGIVTYGAKSIIGSKTGLFDHLKMLGVKCVFLHCIIHQEALCGKIIKINPTMKMVVNTVNIIRGGNRAQRHRAFISFLEEMDADYGDSPLHSGIRRLSA